MRDNSEKSAKLSQLEKFGSVDRNFDFALLSRSHGSLDRSDFWSGFNEKCSLSIHEKNIEEIPRIDRVMQVLARPISL